MSTAGNPKKAVIPLDSCTLAKLSTKPFHQILLDIILFLSLNCVSVYSILFFTPDSSVAMSSVVWVGIIAWRGGLIAGGISSIFLTFSNLLIFNLPPHNKIELPIQMFFGGRVPGICIGLIQTMICGLIIGYISVLVHKLRIEIELRKKTQLELEQKNAELDAFGHTVAHDLKNPLAVIKISIDRLISDLTSCNDSKILQKLNFINDSTEDMQQIIESILVLAGINRTKQSESVQFPMIQSVDDALARLKYSINSNGVTIKKAEQWPNVIAYPPWITEVWVNYINNAIVYGGIPAQNKKPVIELGYEMNFKNSKSAICHGKFWVRDNGMGIPDTQISKLFKEFTRLQSGKKGHGLGLSIVKSIISRFDGEVGVESEIGRGSLFYFTLPIVKE